MDQRIKLLRKKLNLTQEEFASRLGIKRGAVANYEIGRNPPTDSVISLICREYNVNDVWLRTGEGEMFLPATESALDALSQEYGLSEFESAIIKKFVNLRPEIRQGILDYAVSIAAILSVESSSESFAAPGDEATREQLHAELDRQLDLEKKAAEKSGAS